MLSVPDFKRYYFPSGIKLNVYITPQFNFITIAILLIFMLLDLRKKKSLNCLPLNKDWLDILPLVFVKF